MREGAFGNTFVTGATGLLGSELVAQLLKNGESSRLVCLVRDRVPQSRYFQEQMHEQVVTINGDIRDEALMDRILNEYEISTVFHLAAQTLVQQANARPSETLDVNIRGTWSLLEAARNNSRNMKRIICASSDKAYGDLRGQRYDETFPLEGRHPYDVSKSCSDLISKAFAVSYGMNVTITRCGNFFGPGDLNESRIIPHTVVSFLRGKSPVIRSNGKFIRDYIHVTDGASAYRTLAHEMVKKPLGGEAYNFSYELGYTVLEIVERIGQIMGVSFPPQVLNRATQEIPVQRLDSRKAREELGWAPQLGFDRAIENTVDWYRLALEKQWIRW